MTVVWQVHGDGRAEENINKVIELLIHFVYCHHGLVCMHHTFKNERFCLVCSYCSYEYANDAKFQVSLIAFGNHGNQVVMTTNLKILSESTK